MEIWYYFGQHVSSTESLIYADVYIQNVLKKSTKRCWIIFGRILNQFLISKEKKNLD